MRSSSRKKYADFDARSLRTKACLSDGCGASAFLRTRGLVLIGGLLSIGQPCRAESGTASDPALQEKAPSASPLNSSSPAVPTRQELAPAAAPTPSSSESPPEQAPASGGESAPRAVETVFLAGVVLEKGSGVPLEGVAVSVLPLEEETETDGDGRFSLSVPPGRYVLMVAMPAHKPLRVDVTVGAKGQTLKPIFLEPREDQSAAMVVQTRRQAREARMEQLTVEEIERTPGTFGDPVRAIESLPNVSRPKLLDGALVVRGAEPENTVVYWEGHPIPFLYHFGIWKSVVNPFLVSGVRFYPGALPASYGDVLQAVVEVDGREVPRERLLATGDVNLTDTSLAISTPLPGGNWGASAAGRFSYVSLMVLGGTRLLGAQSTIFPQYSDFQARVDGTIGSAQVSLSFLGARDSVRLGEEVLYVSPEEQVRFDAFEVDPHQPYVTEFYHLQGVVEKSLGKLGTLYSSTLVGLDRQISLIPFTGGLIQLPPLTRIERPVFGERLELRAPVKGFGPGVLGLELRYRDSQVRDLTEIYAASDGEVAEEEHLSAGMASAFGRVEWELPGGSRIIPEARASLYGFKAQLFPWLEPRVTYLHPLKTQTPVTVKAATGLQSQMPEERQYAREGNVKLGLMKTWQASLGADVTLGQGLNLETSLFGGRMWDLVLKDTDLVYQTADTGTQVFLKQVLKSGDGWGYGGEVTLKRASGQRLSGSASYAYTRGIRRTDEGWFPGDYDQPHTLTVMASARLFERIHFSGRFRLGSGQPYTPYEGVWSSVEQAYLPRQGAINSARMPLYHQLDIRFDRTILKDRYRANYYLDIQNVYLARNPIIQLEDWNYQNLGSYVWLPLVPTLGVKGEF